MASIIMSPRIRNNQNGFASMFVAIVIMLVLSLLTIGFAQLARNEQTRSLDRQLAVEAQDAAESGINDAWQDIQNGYIVPSATQPTGYPYKYASSTAIATDTTCMTPSMSNYGTGKAGPSTSVLPSSSSTANPQINPTNNVEYTCLLVNLEPSHVTSSKILVGGEWSQTFSTTAPLTTLSISWGSADGQDSPSTSTTPSLPSSNNWSYGPLVQLNITPLQSISRSDLLDSTLSVFLYPSSNSSATNNIGYSGVNSYTDGSSSNNGQFVYGNCGNTTPSPYACNATITNLNLGSNYEGPYLVTATTYYDSAFISLSSSGLNFTNSQAIIDVTGRAQNVLKRIVKTIPLSPTTPTPTYALEAQNICKRLSTAPGITNYDPDSGPCDLSSN